MPRSNPFSSVLPPALLLGLIAASGCATIDNDRLTVAGDSLPVVAGAEGHEAAPLQQATGPSVTSVDRTHWPEHEIVVWQDGVRHHPHFTSDQPRYAKATARQRGAYPTAESALELGADPGAQVWEGFAGPVWGGMDVVLFLPRAIAIGGPGALVASPDATYSRAPNGAPAPALEAAVEPIEPAAQR